MTSTSTPSTIPHDPAEITAELFDNWFDPIEAAVRERVREFIQAMIEDELEVMLFAPAIWQASEGRCGAALRSCRDGPPPWSATTIAAGQLRPR